MPSRPHIFAPPKDAVLSLEVQARMGEVEREERSQFELLVRHFLDRFFNNEMVSAGGGTKARVIQVAYAIALPGLIFAIYLFPPYHYPGGRPFWSQVSDHYFYVMYSFVAMGVVTLFEWDLFFPDLLDAFVLCTLSIERRRLFLARLTAVAVFLGIFLLGTNALGTVFFPASADLPSLTRHFCAHLLAISFSGAFAAAALLALQGAASSVLGERFFRVVSPFLQGLSIMVLLTVFLLFPALSRYLEALLTSRDAAARFFPPFWFLGIYECLLHGGSALPVFAALARTGCVATALAVAVAMLTYPVAYRRRMRHVVEGSEARDTRSVLGGLIGRIFHRTLLRLPRRRGIHHFISQTLLRRPRHRVYLAMYGGLGLALVAASAVLLIPGKGRLGLGLSPEGLRAAVPIVAFWTVAGLRGAFLSPADGRVNWLFRVVLGKPGLEESATTRVWVLGWALVLALGTVGLMSLVAPRDLRGGRELGVQLLVAVGLCVLLTDAFFLNVTSIPFTGVRSSSNMNLAFVLIQYFGLFPPFVVVTLSLEGWLEASWSHVMVAVMVATAAHLRLEKIHRRIVNDSVRLGGLDDEEEEFPQRLGLRY